MTDVRLRITILEERIEKVGLHRLACLYDNDSKASVRVGSHDMVHMHTTLDHPHTVTPLTVVRIRRRGVLEVIHISTLRLATSHPITINIIPPDSLSTHTHTLTAQCRRSFGSHAHLDIPRLIHKVFLDRDGLRNEQCARPFERVWGIGFLVALNTEFDLVFERMGDFVPGKEDGRV